MAEFKPKTYTKLPVEIEAVQYEAGSDVEYSDVGNASDIIDWVLRNGGTAQYWCVPIDASDTTFECTPESVDRHDLRIKTLEGEMIVSDGDYVIRGVNGEFYPCKPDVFAKTYRESFGKTHVTFTGRRSVTQTNPQKLHGL